MNKISPLWLLGAFAVGIGFTYLYMEFLSSPDETFSVKERKDYDIVTLKLPRPANNNPLIFGPKYWEAYHRLTERIPCPGCRSKAVPFMKFFHDLVNQELKKTIVYPENLNKHLEFISKLPKA